MSASKYIPTRLLSGRRLLLLSSLILSTTLSGCLGAGKTRTEFLTPRFAPTELICKDTPRGQLPSTATNEQAAERIIGIDEAGEDCRQKLARVKMKVEVYEEVSAEIKGARGKKKK